MSEYIEVPSYFNKNIVDCNIIENFLNGVEYLDEKQINIDDLRKFYSLDKKRGVELINELKLRGFNFKLNSYNSLLSTIEYKGDIEIIFTEKDNDKLSKVNKNIFNYFDYGNKITTDFYFNLIPIHAFENITKDFNYELIKQEFLRYGYQILNKKEIKGKTDNKDLSSDDKKSKSIVIPELPKYTQLDDIDLIIKKIIKLNGDYENKIKKISIEDILPENVGTERAIKARLKEDNIHTINELMCYNSKKLKNIKGVGVKRINEFKKHIIDGIRDINEGQNSSSKNLNDSEMSIYINTIISKNPILERTYKKIKLKDILPNRTNADSRIRKTIDDNMVKNIYDLIEYDIYNIKNVKGVGTKKISDIVKIIKHEIESTYSRYKTLEYEKFILEEHEFNIFKDYKIKEINDILYDGKKDIEADLLNETIGSFQNTKYKDLNKTSVMIFMKEFNLDIKNLLNIDSIVSKAINKDISKRDKNIIYERNMTNKTLEEIGQIHELTRERVRQIESINSKKYNVYLKQNKFNLSLKFNFENKDYFNIDSLKNFLTKNNYVILNMIMNGSIEGLHYYKPLDRVYFEPLDEKISSLQYIIEEAPDYGTVDEDLMFILELLSDIFSDISYEESIKILEIYDLKIKGTYYFKGFSSTAQMLEIVYKYIHESKLVLNEQGAQLINEYFNDIFNIKINNNMHNWGGITSRVNDIILIGPRTYIHVDHIPIKTNVINKIKDIIDEEFLSNDQIYAGRLFNKINISIPGNKIISKQHIYSLVKYYYDEFFQTSSGNSLKIIKKGVSEITNIQRLYDICLENGGVVDYKTVKKRTKWHNHRIEMAVGNNSNLIKLGSKKCAIIDMLFIDNEEEIFKNIVKKDMKLGYTSTNRIYERLIFNDIMNKFIDRNNIENGKELPGLMKYVDSNILGHNIFMYYQDQYIENMKDVICKKYTKKIYRNEIAEILNELRIIPGQISFLIKDLLIEKEYIQISREEYLRYDEFIISKNIVEKILSLFDELSKENGYVIPNNHISMIVRELEKPKMYNWNQHIIAAILTQNGYKQVERYNSSYRYEILVLVKKESKYNDISYLIYDLIKNQYEGTLHEIPVYDFLSKKGIYKWVNEDYNKKLYLDAKENDLISVDIVGNIKLKE